MDKSAIEAIAKLAIQENTKNENFLIHFADQKVHDLERYQVEPNAFRGVYETSLVDQFAFYLNSNGSESTQLFVNHKDGKAKAIIDMGSHENPLWGRHIAKLVLQDTPEYEAILKTDNKALSQQDFIDFLEDYGQNITLQDENGVGIDFVEGIAKFRKLKIDTNSTKTQEIGNYSAHASALESIEIAAAGNETPPAKIVFTVIPHEGFSPQRLVANVRAMSDGKKISLKYRITALESAKEAIAVELVDNLMDLITVVGIKTYIGTMNYQSG